MPTGLPPSDAAQLIRTDNPEKKGSAKSAQRTKAERLASLHSQRDYAHIRLRSAKDVLRQATTAMNAAKDRRELSDKGRQVIGYSNNELNTARIAYAEAGRIVKHWEDEFARIDQRIDHINGDFC